MKHTTFENEIKDIRKKAVNELKEALKAHGGQVVFTEEILPLPTMNDGLTLLSASMTEEGVIVWFLNNDEELLADENRLTIEEILQITDFIPVTKDIDDVSGVYPVPVTWVDTDDIEGQGFDTDGLTQDDLANIADRMCETYLNYAFSEDLRLACEDYGLKQKEEEED